ncbi:hypothetical protein PILCRDRAFT_14594 [Piloderma croceum F 1598]|uniref:Terpene synthase n=1 Tax=Piloderma croceum (strain F 1598) TaxID=765440 RepID=A0A0C3AK51_PILCF|nr:hypothetical protein PILCRDRAFT_14594 [Piloderma croceum F 1598]
MVNTRCPLENKESFLHKIKGSQVIIPDLYALFPGWVFNINSNYDIVKKQTDIWLESWVESDSLRHRMQIADFAKFAACFYPDAQEEECLIMSYYHLWIFLWDDELDCGPLTDDPQKALLVRKETDATLDYTLGEKPFDGHPPLMAPAMSAFSSVAEKVVAGTTTQARQRILSELKSYVGGACILPFYRNNGTKDFLTVKGYLEQREASGGCGATIALILYVYHLNIPASILDHEAMRTIKDQASMLVHLINDIVSFHKELTVNQFDSIVPVLAIENKCSLQQAIDDACKLVCEARRILEDAEKRVPVLTGHADLDRQIKQYIQGCKDVVSGVLQWSYRNERYFGKHTKQEGNKIFLDILQ